MGVVADDCVGGRGWTGGGVDGAARVGERWCGCGVVAVGSVSRVGGTRVLRGLDIPVGAQLHLSEDDVCRQGAVQPVVSL